MAAYLAQDEIIRIAKLHDVSMIHPGYGFLSENASFAQKCADNGIAFVGPDAHVIEALGDKTKARTIGTLSVLSYSQNSRNVTPMLTAKCNQSFDSVYSCCGWRSNCTGHPWSYFLDQRS